jgi:hypothetical protein
MKEGVRRSPHPLVDLVDVDYGSAFRIVGSLRWRRPGGGQKGQQRRPGIWRLFGPFLAYHTFGFTGEAWLDTLLLSVMQVVVLVMMFTGFRMARHGSTGKTPA